MENICRFCFLSSQDVDILTENSSILNKFNTSMRLEINFQKSSPNKICQNCKEQINMIYKFYNKVKVIEEALLKLKNFKDNNMTNFYLISNIIDLKEEAEVDIINTNTEKSRNDCQINNNCKIYNDSKYDESVTQDDDIVHHDTNEETKPLLSNDEDKLIVNIDQSSNTDKENIFKNTFSYISNFKCLTCFECFESHSLLLLHYNTEHYKKSKLKNIEGSYKIETVDRSTSYVCNICTKKYGNKKSVLRHIMLGHMDKRPFICKLCGRTYKTASEIIRHGRAHDGTRLFCSQKCGYSTVYLGALKEHERRHNKEVKYKCEECGKGFQVKTWYEQHQNVHTGVKPFVCQICGVAFHMDRYLTSHRSAVHPQSSNLKRYVCVHCSLPCDSTKALKLHLKVHGINTSFLCDLCGKTLTNAEQLKSHKRSHLGDKPFTCSTCNKCFSKKFNLKLHERIHTGEKSHCCVKCGKSYSQRSTLLRHNLRHHGDAENTK